MSVIWSWTYFYNLHWNNYLYFKGLLYIWEEMIMMVLLHMAGWIGQEYSAKVSFSIFQSLKRIQPLPVCAGFFICIRNSLDRPCVTIPSWSSPLKCKVSLLNTDKRYNWVSERITNKRKILKRSGEGVKGRCLPWSKEQEGALAGGPLNFEALGFSLSSQ
jgi:hypothetical protein